MFIVVVIFKDVFSERMMISLFVLGEGACSVLDLFPVGAVRVSPLDCTSKTESFRLRVAFLFFERGKVSFNLHLARLSSSVLGPDCKLLR